MPWEPKSDGSMVVVAVVVAVVGGLGMLGLFVGKLIMDWPVPPPPVPEMMVTRPVPPIPVPELKVGKGGNSDAIMLPVGKGGNPVCVKPVPFKNGTVPVLVSFIKARFFSWDRSLPELAPILDRPVPGPPRKVLKPPDMPLPRTVGPPVAAGPIAVSVNPEKVIFPNGAEPAAEIPPVPEGPLPSALAELAKNPDVPLVTVLIKIPVPINPDEFTFPDGPGLVAVLTPVVNERITIPPEAPVGNADTLPPEAVGPLPVPDKPEESEFQ